MVLVPALCSSSTGNVVSIVHQLQGWLMGNFYKLAYINNLVSLASPHVCPWCAMCKVVPWGRCVACMYWRYHVSMHVRCWSRALCGCGPVVLCIWCWGGCALPALMMCRCHAGHLFCDCVGPFSGQVEQHFTVQCPGAHAVHCIQMFAVGVDCMCFVL